MTKALTIRIPSETYDTLSRLALEDDRTIAKYVSRFLVQQFSGKPVPVSPGLMFHTSTLTPHGGGSPDDPTLTLDGEWLSPQANRGSDLEPPVGVDDAMVYVPMPADPPPSGKS